MKLHEFKALLSEHPDKPFRLLLPTGAPVPVSFHVTEVGRVQKSFLDCGGRMHDSTTCQLQVWLGGDEDHRISAGKMAAILDKARSFLPDDTVPVEVEYEDRIISQYRIQDHALADGAIVLRLAGKHTDCLARELCGVPDSGGENADHDSEDAAPCCAGAGCR